MSDASIDRLLKGNMETKVEKTEHADGRVDVCITPPKLEIKQQNDIYQEAPDINHENK